MARQRNKSNRYSQAGKNPNREPRRGTLDSAPEGCRATQIRPNRNALNNCSMVAIDIEFQEFKHESHQKWGHRVGRIAIVNERGETILDTYAAYPGKDGVEKKLPPKWLGFGVEYKDLKYANGAQHSGDVERWVKDIIRGKGVILWGGCHDRGCFPSTTWAEAKYVDDIQTTYARDEMHLGQNQVKLKTAAERFLGDEIQAEMHSPVEDAVATMQLALRLQNQGNTSEV